MIAQSHESKAVDIINAEPLDIESAIYLRESFSNAFEDAKLLESEINNVSAKSNPNQRLAALYYAIGNMQKAYEYAEKLDNDPIGELIKGFYAEKNNDLEKALKNFKKAAQLAPTIAVSALKQADILRKLGKSEEALEIIEKQKKQFSDKAELYLYQGRILEDQFQLQEAFDLYQKAIELNPKNIEAIFRIALIADLRGLDELAKDCYRKIGPENGIIFESACLNLALMYEDEEDYEKAALCCRKVVKLNPRNSKAKLFLKNIESSSNMYYSPEETKQSERLEAILRVPVSDFELSVRSRNCLTNMNIITLGDLVKKTESEMLAYKNFGETSLKEIKEMLTSKHLRLGMLREDAATRHAIEKQRRGSGEEILSKSIDELELGVRSRKCMETLGVATIGDLVDKSEVDLFGTKNFGRVSLNEIKKKLAEYNLSLRDSEQS